MSTDSASEGTTSNVDPARDFLDFWRNYFEQTAIQTRVLLENAKVGKAPLEPINSRWLESLSESLDQFMRTPAFLGVLKQTLQRMVDLKLLQDQMVQSVAQQTGMPLAADITGLFERVNSAEQAILTRVKTMEDRLKAMEVKLDSGPVAGTASPRSQ
jgi:hypothetical protein